MIRRHIAIAAALALASPAWAGSASCPISTTGPQRLQIGITADSVAWVHWRCHPDPTYALLWDQRIRAIDLKAITVGDAAELGYVITRFALGLSIDAQVSAMTKVSPAIQRGIEAARADMLARPPMYAWVTVTGGTPCDCTKSTGPQKASTATCPTVAQPTQVAACKRL